MGGGRGRVGVVVGRLEVGGGWERGGEEERSLFVRVDVDMD